MIRTLSTSRTTTQMRNDGCAGKRYLEGGVWHDDNGPIPGYPDDWDPPMTDAEVEEAARTDPDNLPTRADQPMRRIATARLVRQRLSMTIDEFSTAYGIPADTLRRWERHEAEPSPAEQSFLRAIERAPGEVRKALEAA